MTGGPILRVAVIGAGTMGRGIAQVAAQAGYATTLFDAAPGVTDRARAEIEATLEKGIARGKVTAGQKAVVLDRLRLETDLDRAVADAELVVEAIPERLELKRELFRELNALAPATAILGSNTSSLSIADIAEVMERPDRVLGLHFFNPVHVMRLVEIVVAPGTAGEVVERVRDFVESLGKRPIVVRDSPGFATSRLGLALGLEAMRMMEEGVASVEDIDLAMELGYNHPMGPLKLTDWVGLDVRLAIAEHLARTIDARRFDPPEVLRRLVAEGKLGRKSGEGFYLWREGEAMPKKWPTKGSVR
ncbi:MAG TPA: 3-hydroxyacyl-CoA dehydrogenase family protein [Gemmatimonadota bacterium]|nr:3-hydroxyacyl-CoA dehydrogenase family protein [Gemmatimonadota bacterium]